LLTAIRGKRDKHMKYSNLILMSSLLAACASHRPAPAASSASVDAATNTPSNDTTPIKTDVMRAAEADRRADAASTQSDTSRTPAATPSAPAASSRADARASNTGNAAATTSPSTETTRAGEPQAAAPDNARVNARDRSGDTLTPVDQGGSEADRTVTQHIRQAVMKESSLSFTAKNVKIITVNGKVTLRGPVNSAEERATIEAAARKVAGVIQVENLLEVKK
jgi:osmotically-inducible protein OsmY